MALRDHAEPVEREARERARRALLPKAFGDFIAGLATWSWFVTITFKGEAPSRDVALEDIKEWLADLQAVTGRPMGWIIAEEFGRAGGRWHCHLLVSEVSQQRREFWWKEAFRRFGRSRIEPFDPQRAAAFYAAKYAAKSLGAIHFGGQLAGRELDRMAHSEGGRRYWQNALSQDSRPCHTHGIAVPSADVERILFRLGLRRWHR